MITNELIEKVYNELLDICKQNGLRVRHIDMKDSGDYGLDFKNICVNKKHKHTLYGLKTLSHEYFHYIDHRRGRFKRFYKNKFHEDLSEIVIVIKAEFSASRQAQNFLKTRGIETNFEELMKSKLAEHIEYWLKAYFR